MTLMGIGSYSNTSLGTVRIERAVGGLSPCQLALDQPLSIFRWAAKRFLRRRFGRRANGPFYHLSVAKRLPHFPLLKIIFLLQGMFLYHALLFPFMMLAHRAWVGAPNEHLTFGPATKIPTHFVYNRFPDPSAFSISSKGHPNTLRLTPSVLNLTGLDGRRAETPQTFIGRRQEHVEFTLQATLDFDPGRDEEEAGITVFLNQAQHFDLGVVALSPQKAVQAGYSAAGVLAPDTLSRYIRLRAQDTTNIESIADHDSRKIHLQIEAVNNTWYAFRYMTPSQTHWTTLGWGISSHVSGGFTGTYPVRRERCTQL